MRALVTGISGFVGGHLAELLLDSGDEVSGLSVTGVWPLSLAHLARRVRLSSCNLAEEPPEALAGCLARERPEVIYHLAAQANPQASLGNPRATWALNLGGTLNLLEALRKGGLGPRVVLVGSGVCYGNPAPEFLPVAETCPLRPNNPYAASKAAADLLGIQHALSYGTETLIARPFNHAGPRQSPQYVLASLARQIAEVESGRREAVEVGNLDVIRDFTDVRDIARAYRLMALKGRAGEVYNVGTGLDRKLSDLLEILRGLARVPIEVRVDPARLRPVDQPRLLADAAKLRAETGWAPLYPIERTLADMLGDAREALSAGPTPAS
ncbi:MAG: GDP-mannose 4,6-dehydratase [Isosphaeraceae bacterium]